MKQARLLLVAFGLLMPLLAAVRLDPTTNALAYYEPGLAHTKKDEMDKAMADLVKVKNEGQDKAIAEIEKIGGKVARDEETPGKPVVFVDSIGTRVTDAGLRNSMSCLNSKRCVWD